MAAQNCPSVAAASGRGNRGGLTLSGPLVGVGRSSVGENPPTKPTQNALAQNALAQNTLAQNALAQNAPTPEPIYAVAKSRSQAQPGSPRPSWAENRVGFAKSSRFWVQKGCLVAIKYVRGA